MEREQAIKFMLDLLKLLKQKKGSDLFVTVGFPPAMKVDGRVTPVSKQPLTPENAKALTYCIMNDRQLKEYESTKECNFAIAPPGVGRFRCNAFIQQSHPGLVMRAITTKIPTLDGLGLPDVLKDVCMTKYGLVVMVGGTGTGKSTSLAAMVDYRNQNSHGHIVTVEDPIEFVHPHKNCIVMQREVGVDTEDWGIALKNSLHDARSNATEPRSKGSSVASTGPAKSDQQGRHRLDAKRTKRRYLPAATYDVAPGAAKWNENKQSSSCSIFSSS